MKKLFLGALSVLVLAACSNDDLVEANRANDVISFGVVANSPTRAADVYCNNNLPSAFNVWAKHQDKTYIEGDEVVYTNSKWENQSGVRYWPNEGEVDFYAHVNAGDNFVWNSASVPTIENFEVGTDVAAQTDLLYSVKTGQTKSGETAAPVTLNFRHALSQIVFKAKNTNANMYVEISGVKVCNVGNTNTFTYPSVSTDNNIENHDGTQAETVIDYTDGTWGVWNTLTSGTTVYPVTFDALQIPGNNTAVSLTADNDNGKEFNSNAMLLLPQTTTAWNPETYPAPAYSETNLNTGSYFLLNCLIYNVAGTEVDKITDVCLWGTEQTDGSYVAKELAIPVTFDLAQGKKYVYTFLFGKGNGGFNPDPDTPDPDPVLVPITFEVSVDDFIVVQEKEIESGF